MRIREIAERHGVTQHKVLAWIAAGELRAVNVAAKPGRRPQWSVLPADLEAFEQRRAAVPTAPAKPRKRGKTAEELLYERHGI